MKLRRVTLRTHEVTMESEAEVAQQFVKLYYEALPLGTLYGARPFFSCIDSCCIGKSLPKTDLQPADDLAVLAGEVYVTMWTLSGMNTSVEYLVDN